MAKLITIPLLVLFACVVYFFAEVPIMRGLVWLTDDGLVNYWAVYRLEMNDRHDVIAELTRSENAKTRLFAIQSSAAYGNKAGLAALPALVLDSSRENRIAALEMVQKLKLKSAGEAVVGRLASADPLGTDGTAYRKEMQLLRQTLPLVAGAQSAASLAALATTTAVYDNMRAARDALWTLGTTPEAIDAYQKIFFEPEVYRTNRVDEVGAIVALSELQTPGSADHERTVLRVLSRVKSARWSRAGKLEVLVALGNLGGPAAKKFLEAAASPPKWKLRTAFQKKYQAYAKRNLERIRRREAGEEDLPGVPEDPAEAADAAAAKQPSEEDLLASYGSNATTAPAAP